MPTAKTRENRFPIGLSSLLPVLVVLTLGSNVEAVKRIGVEPKRQAIRGGTDGARLSYMGLLTPNVWAGGQNFHSVREWVSLEWMGAAVMATLEILKVWVEKSE